MDKDFAAVPEAELEQRRRHSTCFDEKPPPALTNEKSGNSNRWLSQDEALLKQFSASTSALQDNIIAPAAASSTDESSDQLQVSQPRRSIKKQVLTVVILSLSNLAATVMFSCIAPFFPQEAELKGANQAVIGTIFGIFEFVSFLSAPLAGKLLPRIGSKFTFVSGLCVTGVTAILFGLLNLSPPGVTFIVLAFVVRIFEAVGDAAFVTASFSITATEFLGRTATIIGILETFSGLGFASGPTVGGALYQLGGYQLPFTVLGCMLLVVAVLSSLTLSNHEGSPAEKQLSMLALLRIPAVPLMLSAICLCAVTLTFIDPTLEPYIREFNLSPLAVGMVFLVMGAVYTVVAPVWGYATDRTGQAPVIMISGAYCAAVALFFLGPSPLLFFMEKTLVGIGISLGAMGFAVAMFFIPTFQATLDVVRKFAQFRRNGYPDNFSTYAAVAGLFQSTFSLGGFLGPTVGGVIVSNIGFPWTTTLLALCHCSLGSLLALYLLFAKCKRKRQDDDCRKVDDAPSGTVHSSATSLTATDASGASSKSYGAVETLDQ